MIHLRPSGTESGKVVCMLLFFNLEYMEGKKKCFWDFLTFTSCRVNISLEDNIEIFRCRCRQTTFRVVGMSGNPGECIYMVGIISPLVEIGLIDLSKYGWGQCPSPSPPAPTALTSLNIISFPASKNLLLQNIFIALFCFSTLPMKENTRAWKASY